MRLARHSFWVFVYWLLKKSFQRLDLSVLKVFTSTETKLLQCHPSSWFKGMTWYLTSARIPKCSKLLRKNHVYNMLSSKIQNMNILGNRYGLFQRSYFSDLKIANLLNESVGLSDCCRHFWCSRGPLLKGKVDIEVPGGFKNERNLTKMQIKRFWEALRGQTNIQRAEK